MITTVPNQVLITPAKKVEKIDKKILQIIEQMKDELVSTKDPKGVGLAAPQISVPLRIFITKPKDSSPIDVFINPEIVWYSEEIGEIERESESSSKKAKEKKLEGCLSIPKIWGYLKRSKSVRLKFMDINGNQQEKVFKGFEATIMQHETDHINGILYTQRVIAQKEKLYTIEKNEKNEEELVEIKI